MLRGRSPSSFCALIHHCAARRPALLVEAELADHPLDGALLVVGIENLEILRQLRLAPVRTQQAMGEPWKVPTHMPCGFTCSSCSMRWRISAAALLVKVTERIECNDARSTRCSGRCGAPVHGSCPSLRRPAPVAGPAARPRPALGIVENSGEGRSSCIAAFYWKCPRCARPVVRSGAAFAAIRRSRSTGGITSGADDPLVGSDGDHGISDAARYDVRLATCHYRPCCGSAGT